MIRLTLPREPFWLDLGAGVRFKVRPATTSLMETARSAVRREIGKVRSARDELIKVGATVTGLPNLDDPNVADGHFNALLAREMARYGVVEWEGVANEDGSPAECNEDNIVQVMQLDPVSRTFMMLYLLSMEGLTSEGNGSAPALPGNSGVGANTATTAAAAE